MEERREVVCSAALTTFGESANKENESVCEHKCVYECMYECMCVFVCVCVCVCVCVSVREIARSCV